MSAFYIFDQFCLDFCLAWGYEEAIASTAVRLFVPIGVFAFCFVATFFIWWNFFDCLKFLGSCLIDLLFCVFKKIIKKVKSQTQSQK